MNPTLQTALIVLGVIAGAWLVICAAAMALFALASRWLNPHQPAPTGDAPTGEQR